MFDLSLVIAMNKIELPHFVVRSVENLPSELTTKTPKQLPWILLYVVDLGQVISHRVSFITCINMEN